MRPSDRAARRGGADIVFAYGGLVWDALGQIGSYIIIAVFIMAGCFWVLVSRGMC